jgi:hypothetical protein
MQNFKPFFSTFAGTRHATEYVFLGSVVRSFVDHVAITRLFESRTAIRSRVLPLSSNTA